MLSLHSTVHNFDNGGLHGATHGGLQRVTGTRVGGYRQGNI